MPSAEKLTSASQKIEVAPPSEPKSSENAQKENEKDNGNVSPMPIQQILQILQNKVRNLEKRKNKLDGYIKEEQSGKKLIPEQEKAISKYDEVVTQLGISKEFCKQFQTIATAALKDSKREARKALFMRQMQETSKVREVIMIQDVLKQLKNENIRKDFLSGKNGACLIEEIEMNVLEQFAKTIIPIHPQFSNEPSFSSSAKVAADHLSFTVDSRNRQFLDTGFTYEKIKQLFHQIQTCGYWEKDIKIVVETQERPVESETPQTDDDLESAVMKDEKTDDVVTHGSTTVTTTTTSTMLPSAPLPNQVPTPTQLFNGNASASAGMIPMHASAIPHSQQQQVGTGNAGGMKTTVTAVENAFYNQMKYSQPQGAPMVANRYVEDFASANISFLQDSLVEQTLAAAAAAGSQQNMQGNLVNQPKHSPVQQQKQPIHQSQQQVIQTQTFTPNQTFTNQNFHQQQQPTHHFPPPGLKLQNNIPALYSQQTTSQAQLQQPPNAAPIQQQIVPPQSFSPPQQQAPPQHPATVQNLQDIELKQKSSQHMSMDGSGDKNNKALQQNDLQDRNLLTDNEKNRNNDWNPGTNQQQPPHIDTWTNETSAGTSSNSSNYSRFNRNRGTASGNKYNNYRNSQQPRNYNNGESGGDRDGGPSTFFRNNERFNNGGARGNFNKPRDTNYRAGSGRFQGNSTNPNQRK